MPRQAGGFQALGEIQRLRGTGTTKPHQSVTALEVAVDRSYQEYYRPKFDDYISRALQNPHLQTKAGNTKVPRYDAVAQWTLGWVDSKDANDVKKAFRLCGLVAKEDFDTDTLHYPLKDVFSPNFNIDAWHTAYQHIVDDDGERELILVSATDWYIPHDERSSLFCCLLNDLDMSVHEYAVALTSYMATLDDLNGLVDAEYLTSVKEGSSVPAELEIYAASKMHGWNITLKAIGDAIRLASTFTYNAESATKDVVLVRGDGYFAVKVTGTWYW